MPKPDPNCKGCRGSGKALGSDTLGACACTKRYTGASVRVSLHIPGVGIDGVCQDIPLKNFGMIDTSFIYYEPSWPETD